jgi:hypothetical protein
MREVAVITNGNPKAAQQIHGKKGDVIVNL